jgi:hypothetical protein
MNTTLWLLFAFLTKHFVFDYPLQGPFQYRNKGTYGHLGGILHAFLQGLGTFLALSAVLGWKGTLMVEAFLMLAFLDGFVHYHVDWAKMNLNTYWKLGPTTSEQFWWLLGFDQYLHYLTYLYIISRFA